MRQTRTFGRKLLVVAASLAAVATSCAAFSGDDDAPSDPGGSTADASPDDGSASEAAPASDGGGSSDATTAPRDAAGGPKELESGFEDGSFSGCGPAWSTKRAFASRAQPGRSSPNTCRVCNSTTQPTFNIEARLFPARPGVWSFEAWVHQSNVTDPTSVTVYFGALDAGGKVQAGEQKRPLQPAEWTFVTADLSVPAAATTVYLQLEGTGATPTSCFDLDDVVVFGP